MASEEGYALQVSTVRDAKDLLNSLFNTANIDVKIIEITICKEEVVIGFPQVEDYEHELKTVDKRDGIEKGARYLAAATIATESRQVQVYIRFYLTSEGSLKIEDCRDDNVTIVEKEEADKPDRWKGPIGVAVRWGPTIIQVILTLLGHIR